MPEASRSSDGPSLAASSSTLAIVELSTYRGAIDLATHERFTTASYGTHHAPVAATGYRVDAEHHSAVQRLDEHRNWMLSRAGTASGVQHRRHRIHELLEAADADHRLELTGHRRCRRVLHHR
jgi:hypothetical protein